MTHREIFLYALTLGFEILLCTLVYFRNLQRRLPIFTAHSVILLTCTMGISIVYYHFGFRSSQSYYAYWSSTELIMIARGLAIAELCRFELRAYQGIWAFTWCLLTLLAVLFLGNAIADAWGQLNRFAIYGLTIERDVEISSIVVLAAMLLIRNYYGITLEPLHRWIAVGMCILCAVDILNNTILRDAFNGSLSSWFHFAAADSWSGMKPRIERANELFNVIRTAGIAGAMSVWCLALRKPLPAIAKEPVLLSAEVYQDL